MAATGQAQTSKGQAAARRGNRRRRMFSLVGVAAIVMAAWLVLVPQLRSAATAISTLAAVDPVWLGLAVLAEAGALLSYARLSQHTLAPVRIGFAAMLRIDLATMAVSHITPAGSVVGVGLGYRLLSRSGVSPAKAISGKAVQSGRFGCGTQPPTHRRTCLRGYPTRHQQPPQHRHRPHPHPAGGGRGGRGPAGPTPPTQRRLGWRPRRCDAGCAAGQRITVGRIADRDPGPAHPRPSIPGHHRRLGGGELAAGRCRAVVRCGAL